MNVRAWQDVARQDSIMLRDSQPVLVIGSWLLVFLAIGGLATLAAGRAARQTRRVGLLKAVGATPGLIAAVLLAAALTAVPVTAALTAIPARIAARRPVASTLSSEAP